MRLTTGKPAGEGEDLFSVSDISQQVQAVIRQIRARANSMLDADAEHGALLPADYQRNQRDS